MVRESGVKNLWDSLSYLLLTVAQLEPLRTLWQNLPPRQLPVLPSMVAAAISQNSQVKRR